MLTEVRALGVACPICGRPDWCGLSEDAGICVCMRVSEGSYKLATNGGFVHRIGEPKRPRTVTIRLRRTPDWTRLAERRARDTSDAKLGELADDLGVSLASLRALTVSWSPKCSSWCFPMQQPDGRVIGVRRRLRNGKKLSVKGGREGLFMPTTITGSGTLFLPEGPTDTAALLSAGITEVVGRPSCIGAIDMLAEMVEGRDVVVIGDNDENGAGLHGAEVTADRLKEHAASIEVVTPPEPFGDIRDWWERTDHDLVRLIEEQRCVNSL